MFVVLGCFFAHISQGWGAPPQDPRSSETSSSRPTSQSKHPISQPTTQSATSSRPTTQGHQPIPSTTQKKSTLSPPPPRTRPPAPTTSKWKLRVREKYEGALLDWALQKKGLSLDPEPKGKIIEKVIIARENIIARSDPWPYFLNIFHYKTRESVVRQELLIKEGATWNTALAQETARNLRNMSVLAAALVVACRSEKPGHVVMLVITKDIWSIRFNSSYSLVGSSLQLGELFPTDINILGLNKQLALHVRLSQLELTNFRLYDHFALGQLYYDQRFFGSRFQVYERLSFYINGDVPCAGAKGTQEKVWCPTQKAGTLQGVYGQFAVLYPLFSLASKWGFRFEVTVDSRQRRLYRQNPDTQAPPLGEQQGISIRSATFEHPDGIIRAVPRVYDALRVTGILSFTRSFGTSLKHDISWGISGYYDRNTPPDSFPFDDITRAWMLQNVLPRNESAIYAFASYNTRNTKYIRLRNVRAFALSEDYSLGPSLWTEFRVAKDLDYLNQYFFEAFLSASYRWHFHGDLLQIGVYAFTRFQPLIHERTDLGFPDPWLDQYLQAYVSNISPLWGIGRLHVKAFVQLRRNDIDRSVSTLGADNGLRGYLSSVFEGQHMFRVNVEFRSLPLNLWTIHAGFVLFYDGGAVFGGEDPAKPGQDLPFLYKQSVGFGLRFQFPQFDRETIRIDMGIPLSPGGGSFGSWFSLSFGQAF
ncbi:MAG: hypothetical protein H6727_12100 [Myxococcales bacterium]|nr:hypothetical protein [Myxococcales bacterium]